MNRWEKGMDRELVDRPVLSGISIANDPMQGGWKAVLYVLDTACCVC
jgi:hypothetical protein